MEYEYNKSEDTYICYYCMYSNKKKYLMEQHIKGKKHCIKVNESNDNVIDNKKKMGLVCEYCDKVFTSITSVRQHQRRSCKKKKIASELEQEKFEIEKEKNNLERVKIKTELKAIEEGNVNFGTTNNYNSVVNNNNVNNNLIIKNNFNLQLYLNETCKDAIDIGAFTQSIQTNMEDLMYIANHGFTEGMTRIIVEKLKNMEPHERPIQCSDPKRDITYVKDGEWVKDKGNMIQETIDKVNRDQYKVLSNWKPQAGTSGADDFHKVIQNLNGSDLAKKKVQKNIQRAAHIDKCTDTNKDSDNDSED